MHTNNATVALEGGGGAAEVRSYTHTHTIAQISRERKYRAHAHTHTLTVKHTHTSTVARRRPCGPLQKAESPRLSRGAAAIWHKLQQPQHEEVDPANVCCFLIAQWERERERHTNTHRHRTYSAAVTTRQTHTCKTHDTFAVWYSPFPSALRAVCRAVCIR